MICVLHWNTRVWWHLQLVVRWCQPITIKVYIQLTMLHVMTIVVLSTIQWQIQVGSHAIICLGWFAFSWTGTNELQLDAIACYAYFLENNVFALLLKKYLLKLILLKLATTESLHSLTSCYIRPKIILLFPVACNEEIVARVCFFQRLCATTVTLGRRSFNLLYR